MKRTLLIFLLFLFLSIGSVQAQIEGLNAETRSDFEHIGHTCSFYSVVEAIRSTSSEYGLGSIDYNFSYHRAWIETNWHAPTYFNGDRYRYKFVFVVRIFNWGLMGPCSRKYVLYGSIQPQRYYERSDVWKYHRSSEALSQIRRDYFDEIYHRLNQQIRF